jgi:hypothetical protein
MLKSALAGAFALAAIGSSSSFAQDYQLQSYPQERTSGANSGMVNSKIAQFKSALQLSSEQARHWPRVEAVLRDVVARAHQQEASADGYIQRVTNKVGSAMVSANAVRRLVAAASPLVKSLDPSQKQVAIAMARDMGFGSVAAQFE